MSLMKRLLLKPRFWVLLLALIFSIYQLKPWNGLKEIEWGFDIQGGVRVILVPENSSVNLDDLILIIQNRLNIYGLRDIRVRSATDLTSKYIVVEAAGLTEDDVKQLIASQGKFEGKIGNITVFTNGDIRVRKDMIRLYYDRTTNSYHYDIPLILSPKAAKAFANATKDLLPGDLEGKYLDKNLELYIDGKLVDSLRISSDLRGQEVAEARISGSAKTYDAAKANLTRMKAILLTGSMPTKLEIASIQRVSPTLGYEFLKSMGMAGLVALLLVSLVIYIRYRDITISLLQLFATLSELIITLAVAAAIKWQMDLSSLAGLVIILGTGIDQYIIMTDEILHGSHKSRKSSVKEAMFVVFGAFATTFAAMLPLLYIGVGAIRGFAVTTLIGLLISYFITRPGYLSLLEEIVYYRSTHK